MTISSMSRVLVSAHRCIYRNLALESTLYDQHDWNNADLMLIWSNRPAVVVGRHQCIWAECNLPLIAEKKIDLARRYSGGGTVYHDENNINVSFITSKEAHDRERNAQFIADSMYRHFGIRLKVLDKRHDLQLDSNGAKVSGTAARQHRDRAYHHLTLLVDVDRTVMGHALRVPQTMTVHTRATKSVPAKVGCLKDECLSLTRDDVINALTHDYQKQNHSTVHHWSGNETCDEMSVDLNYSTLDDHVRTLRTWQHIYALSPKCRIKLNQSTNPIWQRLPPNAQIEVVEGLIHRIVDVDGEEIKPIDDVIRERVIGRAFDVDVWC